MLDFLNGNWEVLLPLIAAVVVMFFPQLKPIVALLLRKKPDPTPEPSPDGDDRPTPIIDALKALLLVINHSKQSGNPDAELAARDTAKKLFDAPKE